MQATKSEEDKAALENWRQRVGYAEANKIKTTASNRGTHLHSYIEDFLKGRINESFFESNEQYKNMAKEIIDKGIKGKLEEAMKVVDTFGTDARSITRTLENIKDPEQVEKAVKTENVEKYIDHSKQLKN